MHQRISPRDDLDLLPLTRETLVRLDKLPRIFRRCAYLYIPAIRQKLDDPAGRVHDAAALSFVELAGIPVARIQIELIPADLPRIRSVAAARRRCGDTRGDSFRKSCNARGQRFAER